MPAKMLRAIRRPVEDRDREDFAADQAGSRRHVGSLKATAFICGCGHSGTTLLATILAAHPLIHVPLYESEAFLGSPLDARRCIDGLVAETIDAGRSVLVEKTPRHILRVPAIRMMVPGALFVLMVRDGRDVTASLARRHNGNFRAGLSRWVIDNQLLIAERGRQDTILVRYEDLIEDPPHEIARVCAFLGVDYREELLAYHETPRLWHGHTTIRKTSGIGAEHNALRNWQVNQPIFDGRGRWKTDLPREARRAFKVEPVLSLMRAFGYV